jgi:hypothetical protein
MNILPSPYFALVFISLFSACVSAQTPIEKMITHLLKDQTLETNCVRTATIAAKSFKDFDQVSIEQTADRWANGKVIEEYVLPALNTPHRLMGIGVLIQLPDLIELTGSSTLISPLVHAFFIISDGEMATLCQSWEQTVAFNCQKQQPLAAFKQRLLELQSGVSGYMANPSQTARQRVVKWFLNDVEPAFEKVELAMLYEEKERANIEFIATLEPDVFVRYFEFVESQDRLGGLATTMKWARLAKKALAKIAIYSQVRSADFMSCP